MKRLFDRDPYLGITEVFHALDDGAFAIETIQDVEPILEANKRAFNEFTSGRDGWGDGATLDHKSHVARIPAVIHADLRRKGIIQDQARLKAWLNDPDNAVFRTRPGNV